MSEPSALQVHIGIFFCNGIQVQRHWSLCSKCVPLGHSLTEHVLLKHARSPGVSFLDMHKPDVESYRLSLVLGGGGSGVQGHPGRGSEFEDSMGYRLSIINI